MTSKQASSSSSQSHLQSQSGDGTANNATTVTTTDDNNSKSINNNESNLKVPSIQLALNNEGDVVSEAESDVELDESLVFQSTRRLSHAKPPPRERSMRFNPLTRLVSSHNHHFPLSPKGRRLHGVKSMMDGRNESETMGIAVTPRSASHKQAQSARSRNKYRRNPFGNSDDEEETGEIQSGEGERMMSIGDGDGRKAGKRSIEKELSPVSVAVAMDEEVNGGGKGKDERKSKWRRKRLDKMRKVFGFGKR